MLVNSIGNDGYFKICRNKLRFIFCCFHPGPGKALVMEWTNVSIAYDKESDLMFSSVIKEFQHGVTVVQFSSQLIDVNGSLFLHNTHDHHIYSRQIWPTTMTASITGFSLKY